MLINARDLCWFLAGILCTLAGTAVLRAWLRRVRAAGKSPAIARPSLIIGALIVVFAIVLFVWLMSAGPPAGIGDASMSAPAMADAPPASPSPSASSKPSASKSAAGKSSAKAHATSSAPAVTSARAPGGGCYPSAVVLSLFSSQSEYRKGQDPEFDLYAVSTGSGTCSFNVSPAKLHVVVMSAGRIIWDSADCTKGSASQVAWLSRGVPAQESVTWNRSISLPGCETLATAARAGTYQVQARSASVDSPTRTFKLAG